MSDNEVSENTPPEQKKKNPVRVYIVIATLLLILVGSGAEIYSAVKNDRDVNTEFLEKALDSLMTLISSEPE